MSIENILEIYELISQGLNTLENRKQSLLLREATLSQLNKKNLIKVAFDTRRINQETDYNPRRGLQNYHRSEQFITQAQFQKIENFKKLKNILDDLKDKYGREPEWQDSYCRVLLNTLNKTLILKQGDMDFTETQPSVGSFDYVEELLFTRYRLDMNSIASLGVENLTDILLSKDQNLIRKNALISPMARLSSPPQISSEAQEITKRDVVVQSYDALIDKLFGVYATSENPDIERTITITIKDKINKEG